MNYSLEDIFELSSAELLKKIRKYGDKEKYSDLGDRRVAFTILAFNNNDIKKTDIKYVEADNFEKNMEIAEDADQLREMSGLKKKAIAKPTRLIGKAKPVSPKSVPSPGKTPPTSFRKSPVSPKKSPREMTKYKPKFGDKVTIKGVTYSLMKFRPVGSNSSEERWVWFTNTNTLFRFDGDAETIEDSVGINFNYPSGPLLFIGEAMIKDGNKFDWK